MKIVWREVFKFLSGAFFVTAGASWYFASLRVALPFPFFGIGSMSPEFLGARGFGHFVAFLVTFYFGFIRRPRAASASNP